jgi:hypothetical protein
MEHAPNQRHGIKVLNDGDSERRHIDHSQMENTILSQRALLSNSTRADMTRISKLDLWPCCADASDVHDCHPESVG